MPSSTLFFQCLLGVQCKDFAMIAADQTNTQSIIVMKHVVLLAYSQGEEFLVFLPLAECIIHPRSVDENKLYDISNKLVMGVIGDPGDRAQFTQFIDKNVQLYKMRNGYSLDIAAAVHFTRKTMMDSLRGGNPSMVNMLVAGYDEADGGQLYTVDFLGCALRLPFGVHGFGGLLSLGILDKYYKADLPELEAYEMIKKCVHEVHERLFISLPNFLVKVIDRQGVKELPVITPATYLQGIN